MNSSVRIFMGSLFSLAVLATANVGYADTSLPPDEKGVKVIDQYRTGAAPYHPAYATMARTMATIQGYRLRTADGAVINVRSPRQVVNLQDLTGPTRGLRLDLRNIQLPGNAQTLDIVEIELNIVDCSDNFVVFEPRNAQFGSRCSLRMPKYITLYAPNAPLFMNKSFEQIIKVNFDVLNAIQLDLVTTTTQKSSCWTPFPNSKPICRTSGKAIRKTVPVCELANRRIPMNLLRLIDDA